jgi:hypothetical protein
MSVYDDLAQRLRGLCRDVVAETAPPVERWKVVASNPLVVEQITGDVVLEEGDPDVEIDRGVLADRPAAGATVCVHFDGQDWIIGSVIV